MSRVADALDQALDENDRIVVVHVNVNVDPSDCTGASLRSILSVLRDEGLLPLRED